MLLLRRIITVGDAVYRRRLFGGISALLTAAPTVQVIPADRYPFERVAPLKRRLVAVFILPTTADQPPEVLERDRFHAGVFAGDSVNCSGCGWCASAVIVDYAALLSVAR